ncbi:ty3-gypsy retrotransposon protein [Cucumis melo var. makuwa]|uniref:Ty3-gypsy retrotransposon protein n=1 Tax=Cucumis melo var. makuwa TaxID=1194695 RepID=A0A5D3BPP3_CUCMM|nr:ty3-gypsy retrotransposon protein [Cucumis melo var. makuwa]
MASKKTTSKSSIASDAYTGPTPAVVLRESFKSKIKSKKEAHPDVMSIMMADIMIEAAITEIEKKVNFLMKVVEERDHEIIALREQMQTRETVESNQTHVVKATDKEKNVVQENQPQQQSVFVASLSVQQLQDMIANSILAQYGGLPQTSFIYSKPYTKRIDNLRMPLGYQPPNFLQFDGKDNSKQHIAHFVETCENTGSRGDQLVKQLVRSLKENAFEWYTNLQPEVIDSWEQLEKKFPNRFYSTRHTVSMMELTNTKQQKGEPVNDYINQWRALSLDCRDRLTELSAVEMSTQGMHWGLLYILQGIKPRTFEELATRTPYMELSITSIGTKDFPVPEVRKDKKETKGAKKVVKSTVKESMVVNATPLKFSKRKEGKAKKKDDGSERGCVTLKERQEKVYPFLDSDIADMLEQLLEKQLIQLPECKRPEQAEKMDDSNYCKYHWVIGHPVEKCFVLKELILRLAREKKIELDLEEVAQTNHAADENPRVVTCHAINATEEESIPSRLLKEEGVSKDLSRFNVDDLLSLPQETKTILINDLLSTTSSSSAPTTTYESTPYCMFIDFFDEDLLLGSKHHNRPLYVGCVREQRVDQILINNGSAVNIMPKSTMRPLGILVDELSNSKLVIQGFNQGSQRVIGMVRLELIIGDLKASALFHVIDSRTTYKLLLGRPWIHRNGVVTSTLHQCFKFYQDDVKNVEIDSNPFSEVKSHFADAKFYLKNGNSLEAVPAKIPFGEASTSTTKSMILMDKKTSNPLILCYVPLSRCKKGESPFVDFPQGLKVGNIEVLKERFTTPITKITKQEIKIDLTEASLPQRRTKDGFDPKAYKLMAKGGYDFITHTEFKSLKIHEQPEFSSIQKRLLQKGHDIPVKKRTRIQVARANLYN